MSRKRSGRVQDEEPGMTTRIPAILAALLIIWSGIASPRPLHALPPESEVWIRADTAHFTLFSNVSRGYTQEIGHQLELFRHLLAGLNPELEINSPLPTYVFVFRNAQSLGPYKASFGAGPTALDAYFYADRDANYIALNATPEDDWFAPVYHEFVHYMLNNNFTDVPLWFNEGLAEYYSTFRLTPQGEAEIGRPVRSAAAWLRGNSMMPLARLFDIAVRSPEYNEEERQGGYYSQCWALVHYLMWGEPGWRTDLGDRVARLDAGEPLISLVPMDSMEELEKDFARYVRVKHYRSTLVDFSSAGVSGAAGITPIDRAELLYRLGDLLARIDSGKEKQAEKHFRAAIEEDPSHAASYAGLGFLRDSDGRHKEATPFYEKALALDLDDYMIAFLYATNLRRIALGENYSVTAIVDKPPAELLRARQLFRRSLELRPELAEAYAGLGATYFVATEDPRDGIAALETARRLLPSRMDIVFHLMQLYPRVERRGEAQRLMDEVFIHHADAEEIAMARRMLLDADMLRAERMIAEGRHEEGLALLVSLRSLTVDADMQAKITDRIELTRAWLRQRDEAGSHNRQVALYNEAVGKVREKDLDGAAAILEQLAPAVEDRKLSRQIEQTLLNTNLMRAERMMREERYEEGVAFLERLRAASTDPKMRAAIDAQIEQTREWLAQRNRVEAHNRQVAQYNEAAQKAIAHDFKAARAILEKLVPEVNDEGLRRQARDLLRKVELAMEK